MKNIVIIGANDFQLPLILEAKKRGYITHVFAWQCDDVGEKEADYFYPISIVDIDDIYTVCLDIKPDAICSIASDLAALTVNALARRLNLPGNDELCVKNTTNKYLMRQTLKEAGIPTPLFTIVDTHHSTVDFDYPLIVKPTDRSGSRGIFKVETKEELTFAIKEACNYSFEKKAIVEEYIDGDEYSVEAYAFNGNYQILAFTKKYTTGAPHFIERGHIEPSGIDESTLQQIKPQLIAAFKALNIQNSAIHGEFRLSQKGMRIIEIGARMGGDCIGSHLVQISTGHNFVGYVLDIALGIQPQLKVTRHPKIAMIRFLFNEQDLHQFKKAEKQLSPFVEKVYIDEHPSQTVIDSASRHGYYILGLDSLKQIEGVIDDET